MTILHEIGHALGLSHPGSYNGGSPTYANNAEYAQDTHQWTVMSYFNASYTGADWNGGSGWQYAQTPMVHDVLTLQAIYGADTNTRADNTTYGFNSNAGHSVFNFAQNQSPVLTIYDAGGLDTLDLSGFSQRAVINLQPGTYSSAGGTTSSMTYNIGIASNTWIENAIGGSGNDTIYGNDLANIINGLAGDDHLYDSVGNDQYHGGSGTDWVYFAGAFSDYTLFPFANYVQIVGTYIDTVSNSVDWFSFDDLNISYSDILSTFSRTVVDANGATTLAVFGPWYRFENGGNDVGYVSQHGSLIGPDTYDGWSAIEIERNAQGGYDLLWHNTDGAYSIWKLNNTGGLFENFNVDSEDLALFEYLLKADLNGNGSIQSEISVEINGNYALNLEQGQYRIEKPDGSSVTLTNNGTPITPSSFAGWTITQAEALPGTGFQILWEHVEGRYSIWEMNNEGNRVSNYAVTIEELARYETVFSFDFDGDGGSGEVDVVEADGSVTLLVVDGSYQIELADGSRVGLTANGQAYGPSTYSGWALVHAEAVSPGSYELLWENIDGRFSVWAVGASGNKTADYAIDRAAIGAVEERFGTDIDGDGTISDETLVESNGATSLYVRGDVYWVDAANTPAVQLTNGGQAVGPGSFTGWTATQAELVSGGGFEVFWEHADGRYSLWQLNQNGQRQFNAAIDPSDLSDFEAVFAADLDGDGSVNSPTPIESNGSTSLYVDAGAYWVQADSGPAVQLTNLGQPIGPTSYSGWSVIQAETSTSGGYEVLWKHGDGRYSLWKMSSDGERGHNLAINAADIGDYEVVFDADLDGSGSINAEALVESNGGASLYIRSDTYWVETGHGSAIQVTNMGQPIGPNSYAGWSLVQAETAGPNGFDLLWENSDGRYSIWQTDPAGERQYNAAVATEDLGDFEAQFQADLNGDSVINLGTTIESSGNTLLHLVDQTYWVASDNGVIVQLTSAGTEVGPDTFLGRTAAQAERRGDGGFDILWEHSDGGHSLWQTDATGARQSSETVDATELTSLESIFGVDLNGNSVVGSMIPPEDTLLI